MAHFVGSGSSRKATVRYFSGDRVIYGVVLFIFCSTVACKFFCYVFISTKCVLLLVIPTVLTISRSSFLGLLHFVKMREEQIL